MMPPAQDSAAHYVQTPERDDEGRQHDYDDLERVEAPA